MTSEARDYSAAITALNTLQTNFAIVDAIRKSGKGMNKNAIPEMQEWCRRMGYEPRAFDRLNLIHIAGTKGKGSTSAFISSILQQYTSTESAGQPRSLHKVGLYTSPHLRSVRERIQINGEPISEAMFAKYFFEVWDRLENFSKAEANDICPAPPAKPVYFRYLTLMAFHTYLRENVDTAVIECGIGGEYDSTNVIVSPTVGAVTSLGIDHTAVLGETIEDIAWHKSGIFKPTTKSKAMYTVDSQPELAMEVLQQRAKEAGVAVHAVPRHPDIASGKLQLGLAADFQKTNASLAVAVAAAHLRSLDFPDIPSPLTSDPLPDRFTQGLRETRWGGRCEVRKESKNLIWHLDGGHTIESIRLAAQWFASRIAGGQANGTSRKQKRVLLFNQQTRDAPALARAMHQALKEALVPVAATTSVESQGVVEKTADTPLFTHAIFSTNITFASDPSATSASSGRYKADLISINTSSDDVSALTVQRSLATVWEELDRGAQVGVMGTIEEAIRAVRLMAKDTDENEGEVMVLVTGSLHLVGGVLEVLETVPVDL